MGQVIDPNSLLVRTDQQAATPTFFNNLITAFCLAINGIGVRMDGYDVAEQIWLAWDWPISMPCWDRS